MSATLVLSTRQEVAVYQLSPGSDSPLILKKATPLPSLPSHESACGLVSSECAVCQQPIARRDMAAHPNSVVGALHTGKNGRLRNQRRPHRED